MAVIFQNQTNFTLEQLLGILDEGNANYIDWTRYHDVHDVLGYIEYCYSNEMEGNTEFPGEKAEEEIQRRLTNLKTREKPLVIPAQARETMCLQLIDMGHIQRLTGDTKNVWNPINTEGIVDMKMIRRVYRSKKVGDIFGFSIQTDGILWVQAEYMAHRRMADYELIRREYGISKEF